MPPFHLEDWLVAASAQPPIVQAGAGVLRHRALDVPASLLLSPSLGRLIELMVAVMRAAPGVGLAAPQIGVPLRVFVAEDPAERMSRLSDEFRAVRHRVPLALTVVINPKVRPISTERATFYEGCLSVRGYGALVARAAAVEVTGLDGGGRPLSATFGGWPARIMQHETDHLDGTLYVDRMLPRSLAGEDELARLTQLPVDQVMNELVLSPDED
jgi:peptide deformylase